jgi:uncharacterized membrane protein
MTEGPDRNIPAPTGASQPPLRMALRIILGIVYAIAGVLHIVSPESFLKITPQWVPHPELVVFLTGVAEIAGGLCLAFFARLRQAAAIGLALYAICVFPANINHAINMIVVGGEALTWRYHGPRLMLQPVIVWLALWTGGVTDWPFRRRSRQAAASR